ncbi:MAG: apolipoprotein N-acyltransferase [Pseudomonadota bacterium]
MPDIAAWFAGLRRWQRAAMLILIGIIAALGHAPFYIWPATILAIAAVLWCVPSAVTPRQAAAWMWLFGIGYFGFALRWIVEPFLVDVARHGWMAPFALVLMAAGAGLFWAVAGWFAARLAPRSALVLALMLTGAEVLRSLILTGFPWALLGHVWLETGVAQFAAFGGPHLLTLLLVLSAWALAALPRSHRILAVVILVLVTGAGLFIRPGPMPTALPDAPIVRLVQPNAPQDQKWDPAFRDEFVRRMVRLSGEGEVPDIVVWPETAVPYLLQFLDDELQVFSDAARGAPLVFGVQRRDAERRAFNSLVVMSAGARIESIYDKRHLVPFGEYMPGAALLGRAGATGLARNLGIGFTPGAVPGPVDIPGIGPAVPLICYEGIFAEEIAYGDTRPRLLLLITNDAWFGQGAGPEQHLAQARLRAIEQGLPMVRVANTGISAMIDSKGRIVGSMALGTAGALDAALPPALPETLYARFGEWPFAVLWGFFTIGAITWQRRKAIDLTPPAP